MYNFGENLGGQKAFKIRRDLKQLSTLTANSLPVEMSTSNLSKA